MTETSRSRKKTGICPWFNYGWCDWVKVRCHYQDEFPPRPDEKGPCPWASRYAEKHFCPTPDQALHLSVQSRDRVVAIQLHSMLEHRVCPECEKPVRPLRDEASYTVYKGTGLCQDCQDTQRKEISAKGSSEPAGAGLEQLLGDREG